MKTFFIIIFNFYYVLIATIFYFFPKNKKWFFYTFWAGIISGSISCFFVLLQRFDENLTQKDSFIFNFIAFFLFGTIYGIAHYFIFIRKRKNLN